MSKVKIQAHRGNKEMHRENTLQAFAASWQAGADWIELDVHVTKDEHVVVFHDFMIAKDMQPILGLDEDIQGKLIKDLTLDQIKNIVLPSQDGTSLQEYKIPLLTEVIELITSSKHPKAQIIGLNIELKRDPRSPHLSFSPGIIVDRVLQIVQEKGFLDRVQFSSFDPELLSILRSRGCGAKTVLLCDTNTLSFIETTFKKSPLEYLTHFASQMGISAFALEHSLIQNQHIIDVLKSKKFDVVAWTVNDKELWHKLVSYGVDAIITDRPAELFAHLRKKNKIGGNKVIQGIRRSRRMITSALKFRERP